MFATAQAMEAAMLICFGVSWPVDILKAIRSRRMEGKSPMFMSLVLAGYLAGIAGKCLHAVSGHTSIEPVTALYAFNAAMVAIDIALYMRFRQRLAT
jgi:hypothetical protein